MAFVLSQAANTAVSWEQYLGQVLKQQEDLSPVLGIKQRMS